MVSKAINRSDGTVHLRHANGDLHTFYPGDALPDWAVQRITNPYVLGHAKADPKAWAQVRAPRGQHQAPPVRRLNPPTPESPDVEDVEGEALDSERPPETGTASGRERWATYATSKGVEYQSGWKREEIIAACVKAGY